jgi:hypothetical protein
MPYISQKGKAMYFVTFTFHPRVFCLTVEEKLNLKKSWPKALSKLGSTVYQLRPALYDPPTADSKPLQQVQTAFPVSFPLFFITKIAVPLFGHVGKQKMSPEKFSERDTDTKKSYNNVLPHQTLYSAFGKSQCTYKSCWK